MAQPDSPNEYGFLYRYKLKRIYRQLKRLPASDIYSMLKRLSAPVKSELEIAIGLAPLTREVPKIDLCPLDGDD